MPDGRSLVRRDNPNGACCQAIDTSWPGVARRCTQQATHPRLYAVLRPKDGNIEVRRSDALHYCARHYERETGSVGTGLYQWYATLTGGE